MPRHPWFRKLAESWLGLSPATSDLSRADRRPSLRLTGLRVEPLEDRLAPSVDLVRDINLQSNPIGSSPSQLVEVNGTVFFVARDALHGSELWKSDGTATGTRLVKDIRPGGDSSNLGYLTNVNGTLFFRADDGVRGAELWKSDGTEAGTVLVKDLNAGVGSYPSGLTNVNGTLFFHAYDSTHGLELWKTDGTADGTVLVKDIRPGTDSSSPSNLTNVNGTLFFQANNGSGSELWKSDGTADGTVLVKDIRNGGSYPSFLTNVNGTVFFSALDDTQRTELWRSDGTAAGTVRVKSIGTATNGSNPSYLTNVNGTLFFRADDGVNGTELWKSDGTEAGTVLVKNLREGNGNSNLGHLTNVNGTLFFRAFDSTNGYELWKSDGTSEGTVLVKDINSGGVGSNPSFFVNVNGTLYFQASDNTRGSELWKSDGTAEGTVLVRDIRTGPAGSDPRYLTNINGTLFFRAYEDTSGFELWKSDGTTSGTVLVKDIRPSTHGSYPGNLTNVDGTLFFRTFETVNGFELWKTDGTASGTVLVKDILAGAAGSYPDNLTNVDGTLFFTAFDHMHGTELWKSDGTAEGTVLVKDINPGRYGSSISELTNVNGTLFFTATDGVTGIELWKSDGTVAGTVLVKDLRSDYGSSYPGSLLDINGTLFFRANDGVTGSELWKSDGTAEGTVLVKDLRNGAAGSYPGNFTRVSGTLFFTAFDDATGTELWKTDGTAAGTTLVKDLRSSDGSSSPTQLTNVNGTLFFSASDDTNGTELWKTDGTPSGTVLVRDIRSGIASSNPANLTNVHGTLFFSAADDTHRTELWKSDGTAAGTVLVKDIRPGNAGSYPSYLANLNGLLYFRAHNASTGYELWQSDGTAAGTVLAGEVALGSGDGSPQQLVPMGGFLFFTALDETHGRELWRLTDPATHTLALDESGNLILEDNGADRNDTLTLSTVSGNLIISDPNAAFRASIGTVSPDGHTITLPLASIPGQIAIHSTGGDDTLTLDFSGGNPLPTGGLHLDGLNLVLRQGSFSGPFDTITYTLGRSGGTIHLDADGPGAQPTSMLSYSGTASVVDDLSAAHRVFQFTDAAETITLADREDIGGVQQLTSSLGGSVSFASPFASLTLDTVTGAAAGEDTLTIASVDADYRAALVLNTDGGDIIHLLADLVLGSPDSPGHFTVANAQQVNLKASIRTEGGGAIRITGLTDLGADVVLDTDSASGADGSILFYGSINSDAAASPRNLRMNTGSGDVFLGNVGTARPLHSLSIVRANEVRLGQVETGTGGLQITADGTTTLNGTLRSGDGPVLLASNVTVGAAAVILDSGHGALAVTGTVLNLGSNTLTVQNRGTGLISAQITGAGAALTKTGTGTLRLTGNNTWSGSTTINAGTLQVNNTLGSGTGTSGVTLNNSAVLGGTGTISGPIRLNHASSLAPGASVGALASGNVTWTSGTFFDVELDGIAGPGVVGGHDLLRVTGTVALNGSTLRLGGTLAAGTAGVTQLVLIENDGGDPVLGTFQGLPEGSEVAFGARRFYITYAGGSDRNDVVLYTHPVFHGTSAADTLLIRGDGTTFTASLNGGPAVAFTPSVDAGVVFLGGEGGDLLLVQYDATSTDPIPGGGIFFDGESPTGIGPGDRLRVEDLRANHTLDATYTPSPTTPGAGTVTIAGPNGGVVTFAGLEPIDIRGMATATLTTPALGSDDVLTIANGFDSATGGAPALVISGTTGASAIPIETAHFFNNDLVVLDTTANDGNDTLVISSASNLHGNRRLRIVTGNGTDTVTVNGAVTVTGDGIADTADLEIVSQNIAINAPLRVSGPRGLIRLDARSGAIVANWPGVDVTATDLIATASTGIDLDTTVSTVTATVTGGGDLRINETDGLEELSLIAGTGSITVTTGDSIRSRDTSVDVVGNQVRFTLLAGAFGEIDTAPGHAIQTAVNDLTVDTSGRNGNQFIRESDGLTALNLNAGTGNVALAVGGPITDSDAGTDILAATLFLVSDGGVGTGTPAAFAQALQTQVAQLDARVNGGGIFLANGQSLTILDSPLDADPLGLVSMGGGRITTAGSLTLGSSAVLNDSMTLSAAGAQFLLQTDVTLLLNSGSAMTLTLEAQDDLVFQGTAEVVTGGAVGPYTVVRSTEQKGTSQQTPPPSSGLVAQRAADVQLGGSAPVLTAAELAPVVDEALRRLAVAGVSPDQIAVLSAVPFLIADLNGLGLLGQTAPGVLQVILDDDGAGHGWFVDPTPRDDTEFGQAVAATERRAVSGEALQGYDLLTVVMHEMLAVLGHSVRSDALAPHSLMAETLPLGTRRFADLTPPVIDDTFRVASIPAPAAAPSEPAPLPYPAWLQQVVFGRGKRRRMFLRVMNAAGMPLTWIAVKKGQRVTLADVNGDGILDVVITDRLTKKGAAYNGVDFRRLFQPAQRRRR